MKKNHLSIIAFIFLFWYSPSEVFSNNLESAPASSFRKNLSPDTAVNPNSKIISKDAELKLVSKQFSFTEGPAADKKGNVFFTDQPNNKIWKYDTNGEL